MTKRLNLKEAKKENAMRPQPATPSPEEVAETLVGSFRETQDLPSYDDALSTPGSSGGDSEGKKHEATTPIDELDERPPKSSVKKLGF